jgi:hypothetical protein
MYVLSVFLAAIALDRVSGGMSSVDNGPVWIQRHARLLFGNTWEFIRTHKPPYAKGAESSEWEYFKFKV